MLTAHEHFVDVVFMTWKPWSNIVADIAVVDSHLQQLHQVDTMFWGVTRYNVVAFEEKVCLVQGTNIVGAFVDAVESTTYYAMCTTMVWI